MDEKKLREKVTPTNLASDESPCLNSSCDFSLITVQVQLGDSNLTFQSCFEQIIEIMYLPKRELVIAFIYADSKSVLHNKINH